MKVFFLIQRFEKPSSRYRALQYLPSLKAAGVETRVEAVSGNPWGRWRALKDASRWPVVFVQKKLFHKWELGRLRAAGARLIYDFDDAIMLRHAPEPGAPSATRRRQFDRMIRSSHTVLAGNRFLEKEAARLGRPVVYLPTTIDIKKYAVRPPTPRNGAAMLGWLGSAGTQIYLEKIIPALEEVARRHPRTKLKVVSNVFPEKGAIEIERKSWRMEDEQGDLQSFDIGLAPLSEDPWCEGKCGLKLLQYMACGVVPVASPGGAQKEIVRDGENGFLASSPREWAEKISILIENPQKRMEMGAAARRTVEKYYSLDGGLKTLLKVFHESQR